MEGENQGMIGGMKPIICVILSVLAGQSLAQQSAPIGPAESAFKVYELLDEARAISPDNIEMIDASKLSLEELMALAHQERENATRLHCCDWGGGSCLPHSPES